MANWESVKVGGKNMPVYVSEPQMGPQSPVVIVLQEIFGVNHHIRDVADRFAAEGYLVFAPDLFYRQGEHFESGYTDMTQPMARVKGYSPGEFDADIAALLELARKHPRALGAHVGVVGFCMGGKYSFVTACSHKVQAAVCFYGGGIAQGPIEKAAGLSCPTLLFFGGQDKHIPVDTDVKKVESTLKQLKKNAEVTVYPQADHGFFCNERGSYNEAAAKDAWAKTKAHFAKFLRG